MAQFYTHLLIFPLLSDVHIQEAMFGVMPDFFDASSMMCENEFHDSFAAKATKGKLSPPPSSSPVKSDIIQAPQPPSPIRQMKLELQDHENARLEKFGKILAGPATDLGLLKFAFIVYEAKNHTMQPLGEL